MLPKNRRINSELFDHVYKEGTQYSTTLLYIKKHPLPSEDTPSKFSFVVPKSIASSAVKRNKIKRRGNHALKEIIDEVETGSAVIFFFTKNAPDASFKEIQQSIRTLLKKASLI